MNKYFLSIISILLLFQSFKVFDEIFYHVEEEKGSRIFAEIDDTDPKLAEDVNEDKSTWNIDKETRLEIIDILSNHNKSVNIFSGHMHQNKINNYKNIKNIVVSSIGVPLGNDPSGYYKVNYENKNLNYTFELLGD